MKRLHTHWIFAVAAGCFGVLAIQQGIRLQHALRVNAAISGAGSVAADSAVPEAQFARAVALGRAGDYEGALLAYKGFIQGGRADLRQAALYNVGNLHLRAALQSDRVATDQVLPLVELAKQSYRDLLRENPDDWDARYNLERALYLAPESEEESAADEDTPPPKERSVATVRAKMDLP